MKNINLRAYLDQIVRVFSQAPVVGGLEIAPDSLRYCLITGSGLKTTSLRLPPGIINGSQISDRIKLKQALQVFKGQIESVTRVREPISVVVALPFSHSYLQSFRLPNLRGEDVAGAVKLNMQMISPIPIESSYYDWERIDEEQSADNGQIEYLGAFAPMEEVDSFTELLKETGFSVMAVEFASLALTRVATDMESVQAGSFLLVQAGLLGIDFMVINSGKLRFDYFVSWQSMGTGAEGIASPVFQGALSRNLKQVVNFYASKWGGSIRAIKLSAPGGYTQAYQTITSNFKIPVNPLQSLRFGQGVDQRWLTAVGLALRGALPRGQDNFISLTRIGTEAEYRNTQIAAFVRFWRSILATATGFVMVAFILSSVFLSQRAANIDNAQVGSQNYREILAEVRELQEEAVSFNRLVEVVDTSREKRFSWTPFLKKINSLAGTEVTITRIFFQSVNAPVVLSGLGRSEEAVLSFKDVLERDKNFENVSLPLSNVSQVGSRVSFNLSFDLKELPEL